MGTAGVAVDKLPSAVAVDFGQCTAVAGMQHNFVRHVAYLGLGSRCIFRVLQESAWRSDPHSDSSQNGSFLVRLQFRLATSHN